MGFIGSTCTALPGAPGPAGADAGAGSDSASPCRIMRAAADVANGPRLYGVCSCTGDRAGPHSNSYLSFTAVTAAVKGNEWPGRGRGCGERVRVQRRTALIQ